MTYANLHGLTLTQENLHRKCLKEPKLKSIAVFLRIEVEDFIHPNTMYNYIQGFHEVVSVDNLNHTSMHCTGTHKSWAHRYKRIHTQRFHEQKVSYYIYIIVIITRYTEARMVSISKIL